MTDTDDLKHQYLEWTGNSLDEMAQYVADFKAGNGEPAVLKESIYGIAHNVKGMGSGFGFPLMTEIGELMSTYLINLKNPQDLSMDIMDASLQSMKVIVDNAIDGDGGAKGAELVSKLKIIYQKNQS